MPTTTVIRLAPSSDYVWSLPYLECNRNIFGILNIPSMLTHAVSNTGNRERTKQGEKELQHINFALEVADNLLVQELLDSRQIQRI